VGFLLGGVTAVFMPPLAMAIALVLGGVLLWARFRHEDVRILAAPGAGFLLAVGIYVALAVVAAF
jgi:hypothetical protein